jgi:hypothetical protein
MNYQWHRNETNIRNEISDNLMMNITNVGPDNRSRFDVMGSNAIGSVTSAAPILQLTLHAEKYQLEPGEPPIIILMAVEQIQDGQSEFSDIARWEYHTNKMDRWFNAPAGPDLRRLHRATGLLSAAG